jgi:hypothetical protein
MEMDLRLLMRDGAIAVRFRPRLDLIQYAEFTRLVHEATTRDDLRKSVEAAAKRWGIECECEDVGP